ncbi:cytochrome P450 [Xanthomonas sp. NCPPB 1128]|uniref:cytochrome P450 n=1 Tax=Xanthomonas sp. NCPPB 1128 TaxID=1775876 RepID=UPI00065AAD0D|nr:cytochrome P450 [Xanthomonas sp. NCPPB 1128]KMM75743.1 cytochrome P450 [Xanthomonas sp. NCPPB 1128]
MTDARPLPPGPRGHWAFGNRQAFAAHPLEFLQGCAREHGDVVRIAQRAYLLAAPAAIATVLGDDGSLYAKSDPDPRARRAAFPASVMNSEGEAWRQKRQALQPAFRAGLVRDYAAQAAAATQALLRSHDDIDDIYNAHDLRPTMTALCAQLGAGFLLGDAAHAPALLRMLPMVDAILQQTRTPSAAPAWWPSARKRRLRSARVALDTALTQILASPPSPGADASVLERLRRDDPQGQGDWCRDEAAAMLMSALEPMAAGLTWTLLLLAQHPAIAQAVAEEAYALPGLDSASAASCDDALVERLPLARACVKEAMRLYPPAWMTARIAQRDTALDGFAVPRGTQLIVSQWVVQRDARHYAAADRFLPARWLDPAHAPARYTYFPFGGGPRSCIGSQLALVQMTMVVAGLLRERTLHLAVDARPRPFPALVLRPLDVRIALRPRTAVPLQQSPAAPTPLSHTPEAPHG